MDKDTFAIQVKRMERQLYRVAISYVSTQADTADAVQEALLRAWTKRNTLRDEGVFATWLIRILINECKTLLRKRGRALPMAELPDVRTASQPDEVSALRDSLMRLEPKYRVPLVLNALDGYTLREVAQMLHLPEGTVKARISRARQQLRNDERKEAAGDA